jgi:hypothetical protein
MTELIHFLDERASLHGESRFPESNFQEHKYEFRSDSFDERSDLNICVLGCSMALGVGVLYHETWASRLKQHIEDDLGKSCSIWNLSTGGSGVDWCSEVFHKWAPKLKPDISIIQWSDITRRSIVHNRHIQKVMLGDNSQDDHDYDYSEKRKSLIKLQSFSNDLYHWYKNYLITYYISKSYNLNTLHILPNQFSFTREGVRKGSLVKFKDYPDQSMDLKYCMQDSNWVDYHTTIDDYTDHEENGSHPGPHANKNTGKNSIRKEMDK